MTHRNDSQPPQPVAEAESLVGVASTDLLAVLLEFAEEQRNAAYVDANCWRWPNLLSEYKPNGWDDLDNKQKMEHPTAKAAWEAIHQCTTELGRSEAWWVLELGRTREEHAAWIANGRRPVSSANDEMTSPHPNQKQA